jgi:hypothetical protein
VARRTIALSQRYLSNAGALGVTGGSPASRDIARIAAALAGADVLPAAGDLTTLAAPDDRGVMMLAHVRRVEGHNLWLWYAPRGEQLVLVALTAAAP